VTGVLSRQRRAMSLVCKVQSRICLSGVAGMPPVGGLAYVGATRMPTGSMAVRTQCGVAVAEQPVVPTGVRTLPPAVVPAYVSHAHKRHQHHPNHAQPK